MVTYSESGVDIDLEAVTVSKLADKLKSTLEYREIITDIGHYAALVKLGEKARMSINDIFETKGEAGFRQMQQIPSYRWAEGSAVQYLKQLVLRNFKQPVTQLAVVLQKIVPISWRE